MKWRQLAPSILVLILMLVVAGCTAAQVPAASQPAEAPAAEAAGQKLIWSVEGVNELPGLDPANPQNAQSIQAINLIFGGLVKLDADLNVVPDGAESWTISEDGTVYTFTIREGLQLADGTPVTAQDFADSINRALQPETCVVRCLVPIAACGGRQRRGRRRCQRGQRHRGGRRSHAADHDRRECSLFPCPTHLSGDFCRTAAGDRAERRKLD